MWRCRAKYEGSELVDAAKVHAFTLVGHAKARTCYAWSRLVDGDPEFHAVLMLGPVQSAQDAVRGCLRV